MRLAVRVSVTKDMTKSRLGCDGFEHETDEQ